MSELTLYVVMGTTGEYSDRSEWPVRAFVDERKAADLVVKATARAKAIQAVTRRYSDPTESNEFDPNMQWDYTGTEYYIMSVPLDEAVRRDIARTVAVGQPRTIVVGDSE